MSNMTLFRRVKKHVERGDVAIIKDADGEMYHYLQTKEGGCLCLTNSDLKNPSVTGMVLNPKFKGAYIDHFVEDFLHTDKWEGSYSLEEFVLEYCTSRL